MPLQETANEHVFADATTGRALFPAALKLVASRRSEPFCSLSALRFPFGSGFPLASTDVAVPLSADRAGHQDALANVALPGHEEPHVPPGRTRGRGHSRQYEHRGRTQTLPRQLLRASLHPPVRDSRSLWRLSIQCWGLPPCRPKARPWREPSTVAGATNVSIRHLRYVIRPDLRSDTEIDNPDTNRTFLSARSDCDGERRGDLQWRKPSPEPKASGGFHARMSTAGGRLRRSPSRGCPTICSTDGAGATRRSSFARPSATRRSSRGSLAHRRPPGPPQARAADASV